MFLLALVRSPRLDAEQIFLLLDLDERVLDDELRESDDVLAQSAS
jgi:hypothetical protein